MNRRKIYIIFISLISVLTGLILTQFLYSEMKLAYTEKNLPKSNANEIVLITPANITYIAPMSGYYPGTYSFDGEIGKTNTEISFVDNKQPNSESLIISSLSGHNTVINLTNPTSSFQNILNNFSSLVTSGTVEFWIYLAENNVRHTFALQQAPAGARLLIDWFDDGMLKYHDTSWKNIESYTANFWYHVKIEFDCVDDWHLWINGIQKDTDGFSYDAYINPNFMGSCYFSTINGSTIYFDSIGYSWDFNYNVGDNLNEGLLLGFENSTSLDWIGYSLDGLANKTILGNTTIPIPSDGQYNIQVFGNDTIGTMYESNIRFFTVDTLPPVISITYPTTAQEFTNPPSFILSITEINLISSWYTLNGGPNLPFTGISGVIDSTAWNNLPEGPVIISFYVRDAANREDFDTVSIIKTTQIPPEIPGYNLLILIGFSVGLVGIIVKKRLKF